jgi:hypothetical protein
MDYYTKYIKYKRKYLNLIGSGKQTAKDIFMGAIRNNLDNVLPILKADREKGFLNFRDEPNYEDVFEQIFLKTNSDKVNIDWIIKSYINNTFGIPSSLENLGRFTAAIKEYNHLKVNIKGIAKDEYAGRKIIPINKIDGLVALERYLDSDENKQNVRLIEERKEKLKKKEERNKKVELKKEEEIKKYGKEIGEDDKIIELETDKVIIYTPTTKEGSIFYGKNTRWCTAAFENNMFDYYNGMGPMHIIQSKTDPKLKFQIHPLKDEIKNSADIEIPEEEIKSMFNDNKLNDFLNNIYEKDLLKFNPDTLFIKQKMYMSKKFIKLLPKLQFVEEIIINFKGPTYDILKHFINLKKLYWYDVDFFNFELGDSLKNLTKLEKLILPYSFDKPFLDSLSFLTNLKELDMGISFNQELGNSFVGLNNLEILKFSNRFNKSLNNSLFPLKNLKELEFGSSFDKPLGNSLKNLRNLKKLKFKGDFNQPLNNSLENLVNLENLELDSEFNYLLGYSLDSLVKLESLSMNNFTYPLQDSLDKLVNLKNIYFGSEFNQPLKNSFINLVNLEKIYFGDRFNSPINDSLKNCINLKYLKFGNNFNQDLDLKPLTKIENLHFGRNFTKYINFKELPKLNSVTIVVNYPFPIESSNIDLYISRIPLLKYGRNY